MTFAKVTLITRDDEKHDLAEMAIKAGVARVRLQPTTVIGDYIKKLQALEAEAQAQQLGIWAPNGFVRTLPAPITDEELLAIRNFEGIVDGVFNGAIISLFLMPQHALVQLQIAGVSTYTWKKGNPDAHNDIAKKSKDAMVKYLLHKKLPVRLCGRADRPRAFIGCIVGSADGAVQRLVQEGLVHYNQKTANFAPTSDLYIAREVEARKNKVGMWSGTDYKETVPANCEGVCVMVKAPNGLVISTGTERKLVYLACVKIPYFAMVTVADPWGWEANDFLQKHCLGQKVSAVMTGGHMKREYGAVYTSKGSLQELLVAEGLAEVVKPYVGAEVPNIEKLRQLEETAKKQKRGIWNDVPAPVPEVKDLSPFAARDEAVEYFQQIQGVKLVGVIERITSGSKFVVYLPDRKVLARVNVNKIKPYSVRDRFGAEAKAYAKTNYLQCAVELIPIEVDKSGGFRSDILITRHDGTVVDVAEDLVSHGMAEVFFYAVAQSDEPDRIRILQEQAAAAGIGVWRDKTRHKRRLVYGKVESVTVISVLDPATLTIQFVNETNRMIFAKLDALSMGGTPPEVVEKPMEGDCVLVENDNVYRRVSIETLNDKDQTAVVKFLDVSGEKLIVPVTRLYVVPPEIANLEPQARVVYLGCCKPGPNPEVAVQAIWNACNQKQLYMHLMYEDDVLLTDKPFIDAGSLNHMMIATGLVQFDPHPVPPQFQNVLNLLESSQPQ